MRMKKSTRAALALSAFLLGLAAPAAAVDTMTVIGEGKDLFTVHYLTKNENKGLLVPDVDEDTGKKYVPYTLNSYLKSGIASGLQYWADVLGKGANVKKPLSAHGMAAHGRLSACCGRFFLFRRSACVE